MRRVCLLPLAALLGAAGPPLGVAAPGTVLGAVVAAEVKSGPVPVCMVNATIDPDGATFDNLGPSIAVYRRDTAGGTVALRLPAVAQGTLTTIGTTTTAALDYISLGEASLVFTHATKGSIDFIGAGNALPNPAITPVFDKYTEHWHPSTNELDLRVVVKLGACKVPVVAHFQF